MALVFGHRGYSEKFPENTMLAFQEAEKAGADGIELDVQLTRDGQIVIIHDESLDRTTGGSGFVLEHSWAELRRLDASKCCEGDFSDVHIPLLEEYFEWVRDTDLITNIEMKTAIFDYLPMEEKVIDMVKQFELEDRVIISSFNHYTIMRMQRKAPKLKFGFLTSACLIDVEKYLNNFDIYSYHPQYRSLKPEVIRAVRESGKKICCYTVDYPAEAVRLAKEGVEVIIGNRVEALLEALREEDLHD